jgi:tropomodulin
VPKPPPETEEIALDVGDEYERALTDASEEDLVDLAAILGLHSMMNQDQYYTSVTNKKKKFGMKFDSIVKGSQPRALPFEPDNSTDVEKTVVQIGSNDPALKSLNWNNIKSVSLEKFTRLFDGLKKNTHLESLSLANTWMTDPAARVLCSALEENRSLKVLNVESNYISPPVVKDLVKSLLATQTVEEFRATNQKPEVLGVKIEMEIAKMVEENKNLRRLGLSFDIPDARIRVHRHLQKNNDSLRLKRIGSES